MLNPGDPGYVAPGLLQSATPDKSVIGYTPTTATAEKPTAVGYDAKGFSVTPEQTVQGQVHSIIDKDSPLMQQAAARSRAAMNARGLLNSSIAVGAGQSAVIDKATPIAQQDAQAYQTAHINTVNAQNAASAFKAGADNSASTTGAQLGTNVALANAEAANTASRETAQAANQFLNTKLTTQNQMAMAQLDATTKTALSAADNQYRQLLQVNQGAQSMFNQVVSNIANIAINPQLSKGAKDAATKSQINTLNEMLRMQSEVAATSPAEVTALDLSQYFKQVNETAASGTTKPATGTTDGQGTAFSPETGRTTEQDRLLSEQAAKIKEQQAQIEQLKIEQAAARQRQQQQSSWTR